MKFKRSAVPAKVPAINDLALGELAINTYDGKLFLKKDDGTQSIVEIGAGGGGGSGTVTSVSGTGSVSGLTLSGTVTTSGSLTLGGTLALTSGDITGGLGFTPYNATNPAGYTSNVGTVTSVSGTGTVNGLTLTGAVTSSGSLTLGGTLSGIDLSTQITGTLGIANGGTGATTAAGARSNLGLGSIATQDADDVAITGGVITGTTIDSVTNHVGADHIHYKVKATEALVKGNVVKVVGFNAGEDAFEVAKVTSASDIAIGVVYQTLASGAFGAIINTGLLEGINTSAFAIGTVLYPNTTGGFTSTKPTTGRYQALAYVVRSQTNNGSILIEASEPQPTSLSQFTNDSGYLSTVSLTSNVTGVLPVANGGTGISAVGAAGNVLTSDGTAWVSSLPASGGMTYTTVKTANFTASANTGVQTNTSGGAFTVTLPASPAVGAQVVVVDSANSWATNNLTIGRNGSTIEGDASDLTCDISGVSVQLIYNGTTWDVFAQAGGAGGGTAGTLPVSGGGTGATSLAANAVVLGNGTSAVQTVAPSTSGNVLTSNGTTWVSSAAPSGSVSYPQNIQSSGYTLVLSDAGKQIYSTNSAPQTITIPTNASVAFPIGTIITFFNMGSSTITLSTTGVSIFPIGSLTSLSNPRIASGVPMQIVKTATDAWNILVGTTQTSATASYLIVGGGGSGGSNDTNMGTGGGGAGGLLSGTSALAIGTTYTITVGAGGATQSGNGNGNSGSASSALSVTASGGGGGSGVSTGAGVAGASGGGGSGSFAAGTTAGGAGTSGQGFAGGTGQNSTSDANAQVGGGGGGASAVGVNAGLAGGNGGAGAANSITGSSVNYAGGGGGGKRTTGTAGTGGIGGGGNGGADANGSAGTANRGGGGGGAGTGGGGVIRTGGAGGSGVVILSIPTIDYSGITTGSPTVTTSGSNTILQFNSSGSYTA